MAVPKVIMVISVMALFTLATSKGSYGLGIWLDEAEKREEVDSLLKVNQHSPAYARALQNEKRAYNMYILCTLSVEKILVVIRLVISWPVKSMA